MSTKSRCLTRRILIGVGAALFVAGFGYDSFSNELRSVVGVPEAVREKLFESGAKGFSAENAGVQWHLAVAKEGHLCGYGLMTIGAFVLCASIPRVRAENRT
jgi:hypothetical protein